MPRPLRPHAPEFGSDLPLRLFRDPVLPMPAAAGGCHGAALGREVEREIANDGLPPRAIALGLMVSGMLWMAAAASVILVGRL